MNQREFSYDDVLHFPKDVVIEQIDSNNILVVAAGTANWLVLHDKEQRRILEALMDGRSIGAVADSLTDESSLSDLRYVLAAVAAREFAGIESVPQTSRLEGYRMLNIYLTNACNLRCSHCFMRSGTAIPNELSTDDWKRVLSQFKEAGGKTVTLSGGEPLMHRGFADIVEHASTEGLAVTILTNGLLWTESLIERLSPHISEIQFSIDGVDERSNALVRGAGHFQKVVDTVIAFAQRGVRTTVASTFTPENLTEQLAADYVALRTAINGATHGQVFFKLSKKLLPGRGFDLTRKENDAYTERIKDIEKAADPNADKENFIEGHPPNLVAVNCGLGGMSIRSDGHVYYCNRINEVDDYGFIFDRPITEYMALGHAIHLQSSVDNVHPCRDCPLRYICDGGCRIDDFDFHGRLKSQPEPYHQISCTEETRRKLKQRMVNSFNYMYSFE